MAIAYKITALLIYNNIIAEDEKEIYEYGIELILSDLINFSLIAIISILLQCMLSGAVYISCFLTTRCFCGGFHANTHIKCSLSMLLSYLLFFALQHSFSLKYWPVLAVGTIIAWIPMLLFAPVPHGNRPLSKVLWQCNRQRSIVSYAIWTIIALILCVLKFQAGSSILLTLWIVSLSIILAKILH